MKGFFSAIAALCLLSTGCNRSSDEVWDDTKTAGRHVNRGFRSLGGKHGNSRQIKSREEFCFENERPQPAYPAYMSAPRDYIPLDDENGVNGIAYGSNLPYEEPGSPTSSIPGIEAFSDPSRDASLRPIFKNVLFPYNSNLVKGEDNSLIVRNIGRYMNSHPRTYIFIEGHCDERGPAAYNLALGVRRSNAVRDQLIGEGVDPAKIFTISYGKERPLSSDHSEQGWNINRRAEFKVFQR